MSFFNVFFGLTQNQLFDTFTYCFKISQVEPGKTNKFIIQYCDLILEKFHFV